jgi:hypothetical protein
VPKATHARGGALSGQRADLTARAGQSMAVLSSRAAEPAKGRGGTWGFIPSRRLPHTPQARACGQRSSVQKYVPDRPDNARAA